MEFPQVSPIQSPRASVNLAVLAVTGVHWSDLGEAVRVMDAMARI